MAFPLTRWTRCFVSRIRVTTITRRLWDVYVCHTIAYPAALLSSDNLAVNDVLGNYSLTLVDAMDTLALLGDREGFRNAVQLAIAHIDFAKSPYRVQVFESNIRMLGGLLSSHLLASDERFQMNASSWYRGELLHLAHDLGKRLLPAFERSPTGIPFPRVGRFPACVSIWARTHDCLFAAHPVTAG